VSRASGRLGLAPGNPGLARGGMMKDVEHVFAGWRPYFGHGGKSVCPRSTRSGLIPTRSALMRHREPAVPRSLLRPCPEESPWRGCDDGCRAPEVPRRPGLRRRSLRRRTRRANVGASAPPPGRAEQGPSARSTPSVRAGRRASAAESPSGASSRRRAGCRARSPARKSSVDGPVHSMFSAGAGRQTPA
jgi:hypothetical protein